MSGNSHQRRVRRRRIERDVYASLLATRADDWDACLPDYVGVAGNWYQIHDEGLTAPKTPKSEGQDPPTA